MSSSAKRFIDKVLTCELTEQAEVIADELAAIRNKLIHDEKSNFVENIIKLMFLNLRGSNTAFGQIQIISLVAHEQFSYKRIGYVAAAQLLDMTNDLSVLITQEVQKDLKNQNKRIVNLALQFLANCGDHTICQAVTAELLLLFEAQDTRILKNAAMAALRSIQKNPDVIEEFKVHVPKLVLNADHAVCIAGINLGLHVLQRDETSKEKWVQLIPQLTKTLQILGTNSPTSAYIHLGFNDPFVRIKIFDFIAALGQSSTELDDLLTTTITSLSVTNQTGYSILRAAVNCVSHCAKNDSLHALAVNQLGKMLSLRSNSLVYSALSSLSRLLFHSAIFDRESPDSVAVQRYRDSIVLLLDHPDNSIRRRALDVICALVNQTNANEIVPQMAGYLKSVDPDFRSEMVPKILSVIQSFSPNVKWNFENQLDIILRCDIYIGSTAKTSFINLVLKTPEIQRLALETLSNCLVAYSVNQSLCQCAAFIIGELQTDSNSDDIKTLKTIANIPQTSEETMCYIIIAIAKLGNRFGLYEETAQALVELGSTNSLEIQQRCGEFSRILLKPELRAGLLAPLEDEMNSKAELKSEKQIEEEKKEELKKVDVVKDTITPPKGSVEAFRNNDYVMYFEIAPVQNQPRLMIRVTTFGLGSKPLTKFHIQYGVPVGWSVQAQAPNMNTLEPLGGKPFVQLIMVECRAKSKLAMKALVSYLYITQPLKDQISMNPIFDKFGL